MHCDEVRELLDAYALGALDADEAWQVELHLGSCPSCRAELESARAGIDLLALAVPLRRAAPGLRQRLLASAFRLEREHRLPGYRRMAAPPRRWLKLFRLVAAGMVLVAAASWAVFIHAEIRRLRHDTDQVAQALRARDRTDRSAQLGQEIASLEQAVGQTQSVMTENRYQLWEQRKIIQVAFAPDASTFDLYGVDKHNNAYGRYIWSSRERAGVLVCSNLPQLPPQTTFQLWFIKGDQWIDSVKFHPAPDGSCQLFVKGVREPGPFTGLAITIEPSGGAVVRTATSELVMQTEPSPATANR